MSEDGTGPRAAQQAFAVLKRACSYAVELEIIDRNPIGSMRKPKAPPQEQLIYGLEQVTTLLETAKGGRWYALFYVEISTRMRSGELFGLRISDLHLDEGCLRVTKQLVEGPNGLELGDTKTAASKRRMELPASTVEVLRAHLRTLQGKPNPKGLVFPSLTGGFVDRNNFRTEVFKKLLEKAELPDCTFHSLRHAGNCLLAAGGGVSLKALQQRLGQSTSKTTMDIYTRYFEGRTPCRGHDGRTALRYYCWFFRWCRLRWAGSDKSGKRKNPWFARV
jgi:integrase